MRSIFKHAAVLGLTAVYAGCSSGGSTAVHGSAGDSEGGDSERGSGSSSRSGGGGESGVGGSERAGSAGAIAGTSGRAGAGTGGSASSTGKAGNRSNGAGSPGGGGSAPGTGLGGAGGPSSGGRGGISHVGGDAGSSASGLGGNPDPGDSGAAGTTKKSPKAADACSTVQDGDVLFSAPSGTFKDSLSVILSTAAAGAEIRYTTDGTAPTSSSALYATALTISKTTRLRAATFVGGAATGKASAAIYVARAIDAQHDLPVIVLDSYGSGKLPTKDEERKFVDVAYLEYDLANGSASLESAPTVSSLAAFHVRGNSSAMFDKVPYRLELRDDAAKDRDCPVIGMPNESDWALVGPHADKTLIHNNFVYDLGRELGLEAPRLKLVEAYVNVDGKPLSADHYQGVYQVMETIKNQKSRLNLKQLDPKKTSDAELSGGYIFKFEWQNKADNPISCPSTASNCWAAMFLVDPDPYAPEQMSWLTNHLISFNGSLQGTDLSNASTGYPSYIETKSFVDTVIVNEFVRNLDSYVRSQYFYKDRGAKINAGPLWDFDLIAGVGVSSGGMYGGMPGMGGGTSMVNTTSDGWQYEANSSRLKSATADWFPVLIGDPAFKSQLVARWKELRQGPLSDAAVSSRIDTVSQGLANAADRNFKKWNILSQARVEPFDTPTAATWAGQISAMKTWLQQRAAWLDGQWK